jgi:hypothetical protein
LRIVPGRPIRHNLTCADLQNFTAFSLSSYNASLAFVFSSLSSGKQRLLSALHAGSIHGHPMIHQMR